MLYHTIFNGKFNISCNLIAIRCCHFMQNIRTIRQLANGNSFFPTCPANRLVVACYCYLIRNGNAFQCLVVSRCFLQGQSQLCSWKLITSAYCLLADIQRRIGIFCLISQHNAVFANLIIGFFIIVCILIGNGYMLYHAIFNGKFDISCNLIAIRCCHFMQNIRTIRQLANGNSFFATCPANGQIVACYCYSIWNGNAFQCFASFSCFFQSQRQFCSRQFITSSYCLLADIQCCNRVIYKDGLLFKGKFI